MTYRNLITSEGKIDLGALMRIAHRNAKARRYGSSYYAETLATEMRLCWSTAHNLAEEYKWTRGIPVPMVEITPYVADCGGVQRSVW